MLGVLCPSLLTSESDREPLVALGVLIFIEFDGAVDEFALRFDVGVKVVGEGVA